MNIVAQKLKFFRNYDIFGHPISLTMKNGDSFQTTFGGIVSFLLQIFFIMMIVYSSYKLFTIQNLTTNVYSKNMGSSYGTLELTQKDLNIAFKFDNETINNWERPYMQVTFLYVVKHRNASGQFKESTKINLTRCNISNFQGFEEEFSSLGLNTALCPNLDTNLTLMGNYEEDIFVYFQVTLKTCSGSKNCQDSDSINQAMNGIEKLRLEFFITNNIIDENNYKNPFTKTIISDIQFMVDPIRPFYKTADIFLNEVAMTTDTGYLPTLFSSLTTVNTFTYTSEMREQTIVFDSGYNKTNIGDFYFRKSQKKIEYQRFAGDVWAMISYIAGSWSTCYVWFYYFLRGYNKKFFVNCLSNKLYNFPSQKKKKKDNKPINDQVKDTENEGKTFYQQIIAKIEVYLSYDKKLSIGFFGMWKLILQAVFWFLPWRVTEKKMLYEKSTKSLIKDLDIINILKKLQELERIKGLLFNEDQQIVLSFSPKPEIIGLNKRASKDRKLNRLKTLVKNEKNKKKGRRFSQDEIDYNDVLPFKNLILSWYALRKSKKEILTLKNNFLKMFEGEFSKILDISEEDIDNYSSLTGPASMRKATTLKKNKNPLENEGICDSVPLEIKSKKFCKKECKFGLSKVDLNKDENKSSNEFKISGREEYIESPIIQNESSSLVKFRESSDKKNRTSREKEEIKSADQSQEEYFDYSAKRKSRHTEPNSGSRELHRNILEDFKLNKVLFDNIVEINQTIGNICHFEITEMGTPNPKTIA